MLHRQRRRRGEHKRGRVRDFRHTRVYRREPKALDVVDTGDQFVFTDHGVWFIPRAVAGTALKPGSVAFRQITNDGCSPVRPVPILQTVIYANAAGNRISVVRATGSYTMPYSSDDLTDVHSSLFNAPRCIAVSAVDASPERLVYVVNGDMSLTIGKFAGLWVPLDETPNKASRRRRG